MCFIEYEFLAVTMTDDGLFFQKSVCVPNISYIIYIYYYIYNIKFVTHFFQTEFN